ANSFRAGHRPPRVDQGVFGVGMNLSYRVAAMWCMYRAGTTAFASSPRYAFASLFTALLAAPPATAAAAPTLADLSLEQLSDIEVTSVSKAREDLRSAAAAVSVVSQEAIRRSGAANIPEALRLVPGLHVAQQSANTWAVSARGFSS